MPGEGHDPRPAAAPPDEPASQGPGMARGADRRRSGRGGASVLLRLVVSAALLALLLWLVPLGDVAAAVLSVPPLLWLGALGIFILGHLLAALKWRLLIRLPGLTAGEILRAHFAGLASNLFLPGLVGGDVVKTAWLARSAGEWEGIGVGTAMDRLLDSVSVLVLAVSGGLATASLSGGPGDVVLVAGGLLVTAVVALPVAHAWLKRGDEGTSRRRLATALRELARRPHLAVASLSLSILMQAAFIVVTAEFGHAAGVRVGRSAWFFAWPLAKLAAVLPLTFAGIGTREGALVALMNPLGASPSGVAAAGILWTSVLLVGALLGGGAALLSAGRMPAWRLTHDFDDPGTGEPVPGDGEEDPA